MDALTLARIMTLVVKLVGFSWLLMLYVKVRRKSALVLSLAVLAYSFHTLSDILSNVLMNEIAIAITSTLFMLTASILVIEEEGKVPSMFVYVLFSLTPLILVLYTIAIGHLFSSKAWVILGVVYGISGFFIAFSGVMIQELREVFGRKTLWLSLSLIFIGLHQMDYPFLRPVKWFAPIGFTIASFLTLTLLYGIVLVFKSEAYFRYKPHVASELKPGTMIVSLEDFKRNIYPKLEDFPVLAFVRNIQTPETWYRYFITRAITNYERDISPTDLPRMLELSKRYLQASEGGVIVIDCPEYLSLYNGFDAVIKFFATLRDMVILSKGTLIVITEKSVWDEKQWILLNRILKGEA
ncbi:DUF835 domain-containing protein [Pyrococcus sp. ST04]|uniref:DUF835 domain-containing protein n=1 Tax=Pyrococcus sp. ST04 TaxID=1183377 RepID=UPI0002605AE0|nr:DUF835 domain-containing protein [Pyrococcus sp. ST04]AFK22161.1 hypothetical protein Py04_0559 [Pyrococcus sp. ST04]